MQRLNDLSLLRAAYERGFIRFATSKFAQQADYSESACRSWLNGEEVSQELDRACRRALGERLPSTKRSA